MERPWLGLDGPPLALTAWTGLENTTLVIGFYQGRLLGLWVGVRLPKVLTIACSLMNGHGQSHKSAYYGWK